MVALPLLTACSDSVALDSTNPEEPQSLPAVPVALEPAVSGTISSHYKATATLEPEKQADIVARVSGVILDLSAEEGEFVEPDRILMRIEEDAYVHRVNQAEAEESKLKAQFDRTKRMFERDLASAEDFDASKTDLQAAEASRELAELELSHARVTTPFAGYIVERYVDPGQMVNMDTTLFSVVDMSRLLARVHIPAKEFRSIQRDQPVTLTLDSNGEALEGRIILISPIIDPLSGTIKVTVAVEEYPKNTRPGDFAEVSIVTEVHDETLLVPGNAVLTERGEQVVYVARDNKAERRPVKVGFQDEKHCEILEGLAAGEMIVVQGQRSIKDGQPLKILDRIDYATSNGDEGSN